MQIWFYGLFSLCDFLPLVELPNLHLLPALYSFVCLFFSLSQYEIIIFYVLILWTASAGAKNVIEKKPPLQCCLCMGFPICIIS